MRTLLSRISVTWFFLAMLALLYPLAVSMMTVPTWWAAVESLLWLTLFFVGISRHHDHRTPQLLYWLCVPLVMLAVICLGLFLPSAA